MVVTYKADWLGLLKVIADKCDRRPNMVTVKDLREAVVCVYEVLAELKEVEEASQ